jgi:hypothetical protein
MVKVKEMPYPEKYAKVVDEMKFEEAQTFPFVQKALGDQAVVELKKIHQEVIKPIPEGAPVTEKYETAYGNWVRVGGVTFAYIRNKLGEEGIDRFIRVNVDAWKKANGGFAVYLLGLIRFFSTSTAFSMIAKQGTYQNQWLGPANVSEMSKSKLVVDISHCPILDYPGGEDVCAIGCQELFPKCFAEQFKVKMQFNRQGTSCVETLTPLKK